MGEYTERIGSLEGVHEDSDDKKMSRRSFLKAVGGGVAVGAAGYLGLEGLEKISEPFFESSNFPENIRSLPHLAERAEVARNMEEQLSEINKYREKLGSTALPAELADLENNFMENFISVEVWKDPVEVKVEMPIMTRSYGEVVKDVMEKMYGEKSGRLVHSVYNDEQNPYGIFFKKSDRKVSLSWTISDIPLYPNFIDFALHEAAGHGSDPAVEGIKYPTSMLLGVEKGKWRALSKALSIEGQFFNHPGDQMYPVFKKNLGEAYARELVLEKRIPAYGKGLNSLEGPLVGLAQQQEVPVSDIKFNKQACFIIGHILAAAKISKEISFNDNLQKAYNEQMDNALAEIYAEMIKYTILYPDRINHDEDILGGVEEICAAISGNEQVDLKGIRSSIFQINTELAELRREEEELGAIAMDIIDEPKDAVATELVAENVQEFKEAFEGHNEQEKRFLEFIRLGEIPEDANQLNEEEQELFREYAKVCSILISKYPTLIDTGRWNVDWQFDPPLHVWEIREVEEAIRTDHIRITLEYPRMLTVVENKKFVEDKIVVMKNFIDSDAFGAAINAR